VYVWADGVHLRIRLGESKACVPVLIGVRADGTKELIARDEGYRESGESRAALLRDCARRGMRAPVLALGDGALGFWNGLRKDQAQAAIRVFEKLYGAEFPKAVKKITDDEDVLPAFYDYPAEHWIHLRTANSIESTFATVRLRTKVTRGAGSRAAALAMIFKLIESAPSRWRAVNAPHLVALVRAGARFERGILAERHRAAA
jgi:putative transposase